MDELLHKLYYTQRHFVGGKNLYLLAKKESPDIKFQDVKRWLYSQELHQLHRQPIPTPRIKHNTIDKPANTRRYDYEADLIFMREFKDANDGAQYILSIINIGTKQAYMYLLQRKTAESMYHALNSWGMELMENNDGKMNVDNLITDLGGEFISKRAQQWFKDNEINYVPLRFTNQHAKYVESFNKTIKRMIFHYMEAFNTERYIDDLPAILDAYYQVYKRPEHQKITNHERMDKYPMFAIGDTVRLRIRHLDNQERNVKGYFPKWTLELYEIAKVYKNPNESNIYERYKVIPKIIPNVPRDHLDEAIIRLYYPWELLGCPKIQNHLRTRDGDDGSE